MLNINKNKSKVASSKKKLHKPLGRGLGSLLGESSVALPTTTSQNKDQSRIWDIPVHKIKPGLSQPRKTFEKPKLQELAQSIKQQGIIQPITVKKINASNFEILTGERRWRACQMIGFKTIPAIIKDISEESALEIALIENIQRENLNPIEEANAYHQLLLRYNLTQEQISKKVGKDRATVSNTLRLLKLDSQIQKWIAEGKLSTGHAKILLSINDAKRQKKLVHQVISKHLTVHQLAGMKQNMGKSKPQTKQANNLETKALLKLEKDLQKSLGTKVEIKSHQKEKGLISIYYYSNEQLSAISEKLL